MSKNTIKELEIIFRDLFDENDLIINNETSANDIEDWDSITHVQLLVLIEKHFKVTFTSREIQQFKNVGDIIKSLESK